MNPVEESKLVIYDTEIEMSVRATIIFYKSATSSLDKCLNSLIYSAIRRLVDYVDIHKGGDTLNLKEYIGDNYHVLVDRTTPIIKNAIFEYSILGDAYAK